MRSDLERLQQSEDMKAIQGAVDVDIPSDVLWRMFAQANEWPQWNACMAWVRNTDLVVGKRLIWVFEPLKWYYPYRLPSMANVAEVIAGKKVTWEVTTLPGFYARHTYWIEDLGEGRSRFGSWEKAMGPTFRAAKSFWLAHFTFVKNRSLQAARLLEAAYHRNGRLDPATLPRRRRSHVLMTVTDLAGAAETLRMSYRRLLPGIWSVLGGGGNSVVLGDGTAALVVDPKLRPFSVLLRWWIARELGAPTTTVIDTHHHYDHTFGNADHVGARIIAHVSVPHLMKLRDSSYWRRHTAAIPSEQELVDRVRTFKFGDSDVSVHHLGVGHTRGDVIVELTLDDNVVIATGDVGCAGHYPFFDSGEGGADMRGWIDVLRLLASRYPDAIFVPGHGAICSAEDLLAQAGYIEFALKSVEGSISDGLLGKEVVRNVDLSSWRLAMLPVFHYGVTFTTAASNVRAAILHANVASHEGGTFAARS
jgi:glyoxylase-like metal-dependent hydrolase (beta-lactamase superfamily II)